MLLEKQLETEHGRIEGDLVISMGSGYIELLIEIELANGKII